MARGRRGQTFEQRFWEKVDRRGDDECWEWTGAKIPAGYGYLMHTVGHNWYGHRAAWELLRGPIPDGLQIDHLCRNKGCVNPNHLEPVTRRVNMRRGDTVAAANARKTHCPQGHPYSPDNTYVRPQGQRVCRTCANARRRAPRESAART